MTVLVIVAKEASASPVRPSRSVAEVRFVHFSIYQVPLGEAVSASTAAREVWAVNPLAAVYPDALRKSKKWYIQEKKTTW